MVDGEIGGRLGDESLLSKVIAIPAGTMA